MDTKCDRGEPHLHPVGQPVALGVGALHREQDVAPRDDAALWYGLDLDGQVAIVFLPTVGEEVSQATQRKRKRKRPAPEIRLCHRQLSPVSLVVTHDETGNFVPV